VTGFFDYFKPDVLRNVYIPAPLNFIDPGLKCACFDPLHPNPIKSWIPYLVCELL